MTSASASGTSKSTSAFVFFGPSVGSTSFLIVAPSCLSSSSAKNLVLRSSAISYLALSSGSSCVFLSMRSLHASLCCNPLSLRPSDTHLHFLHAEDGPNLRIMSLVM